MEETDKETLKSILEKLKTYIPELNSMFEEVEKIMETGKIINFKNGTPFDIFGLRCELLEVVSYGNDAVTDLEQLLEEE